MKLVLHNYWRSSCSWRVRIALHLKGVPFTYHSVNLVRDGGEQWRPEHLSRNPTGQIPVLEVTRDDGSVVQLAQSLAIIEFLEEQLPEPRLLPADPYLRAHARQLAETVNASIQPFQNLSTLRAVTQLGGDQSVWLKDFLGRGLVALEALTARHAGQFSVGDAPGIADLCLVPQMYSARRYDVDLSGCPTLVRIDQACAAHPAFAAAHADTQPDAQLNAPAPAAPLATSNQPGPGPARG